jgi:hypothetical protein
MDNITEFTEKAMDIKKKQIHCRVLWENAMKCIDEVGKQECCSLIKEWHDCRTETKNDLIKGCEEVFKN